jgi:hypothetical protein
MLRLLAILCVALALPFFAVGDPPRPATDELPAGKWQIEFANGVVEACAFDKDSATEVEPLRSSNGKATLKDGAVVIAFEDDRTERWTKVGKRWVVEHWFPSSAFPCGKPVVGIAEQAQ